MTTKAAIICQNDRVAQNGPRIAARVPGARTAITLVALVDAPNISAWFAFMRKTPGARGKVRSERTIQTYADPPAHFFTG